MINIYVYIEVDRVYTQTYRTALVNFHYFSETKFIFRRFGNQHKTRHYTMITWRHQKPHSLGLMGFNVCDAFFQRLWAGDRMRWWGRWWMIFKYIMTPWTHACILIRNLSNVIFKFHSHSIYVSSGHCYLLILHLYVSSLYRRKHKQPCLNQEWYPNMASRPSMLSGSSAALSPSMWDNPSYISVVLHCRDNIVWAVSDLWKAMRCTS